MDNEEFERKIEEYAQKVSDTEKAVKEHIKTLQENGEIDFCLYKLETSYSTNLKSGRWFEFTVGFKGMFKYTKWFEQKIYIDEPTDEFLEQFDKNLARMRELAIKEKESKEK